MGSFQNSNMISLEYSNMISLVIGKEGKQAGAELGQAQLKLELDFTLSFCILGLVELVGLIEWI